MLTHWPDGIFDSNFKSGIFKLFVNIDVIEHLPWNYSWASAQDFINDRSTLLHVIAWCR